VGSIVAVSSSSVALPLLLPIRPPPLRAIRYNPWRKAIHSFMIFPKFVYNKKIEWLFAKK